MVDVFRSRIFVITVVLSAGIAVGGWVWSGVRFGWKPADRAAHLQQQLTQQIAHRVSAVTSAATRATQYGDLVAAATTSMDRVAELFARLNGDRSNPDAASVTIWVPAGARPDHRALAWTDGPSENVGFGTLDRAPTLFAGTDAGGLRLFSLQPIQQGGQRIGVAVAEVLLSTLSTAGAFQNVPLIDSLAGPVAVEAIDVSFAVRKDALLIAAPDGTPLFDVKVSDTQLEAAQGTFRWRVIAVALLPWALVVATVLATALRRRCGARTPMQWLMWTAAIAVGLAVIAAGTTAVLRAAGIADVWLETVWALMALAIAGIAGGDALQRVTPRHADRTPVQFALEQLFAGVFLAAGVGVTEWLWQHRNLASIEQWHLPVLPSSVPIALGLLNLLISQVATAWIAASALGLTAARWRVSQRLSRLLMAVTLWFLPLAAWLVILPPHEDWPLATALVVAAALAAFGVFALALRRHYRHSSEVRQMVLLFAALFAPVLAAYPLAAASADQATRALIENEYAPATKGAQQPDRLVEALTQAWADIDAVTELPEWLREAGATVSATRLGYRVWNRTSLATNSMPSQIELYGPSRALVSRFTFNVPEFGLLTPGGERKWLGTGCAWDRFAGVAQLGAGERRMLHAERGLCGAAGEFLGAVVVRVIPDYRTLPFVASANPYYDALGGRDRLRADTRVSDLQVVVYGWSLRPLFVSGRTVWPIDQPIADRVYRSRDAFWIDRETDEGRNYHVYFLNDRGGIYAVGYPSPTAMQHATRLAESAALLLLLFLIYLASTAIRWPLFAPGMPPLGRLFAEIRSSFHRKLLLYFVAAAILPVIVFAVAFGYYMTSKLRADVESEAGSVVLMARRVLDELSAAAQAQSGESRPMPNDDMMVWIRQVVDQDVNLFVGSELRATSQRDLFDSGLLPTRTPASVYERVALGQRPVFVEEDRIGGFRYLLAAAPVPAFGRDVVLTVPLASRQREIERQIDELTQGVLTGAVALALFAAALGASVAGRVSDPIARLTRATRLVAAGRFDQRLAAATGDELGRLVDDFNTMTQVLLAQRAELARTNQLKAWAEMSRQVAHEIKNPLTPIQLAAEHLQRVHEDAKRPLGAIVDQCLTTVLGQVRLLRKIASEFSTFAGTPAPRFESVAPASFIDRMIEPYRATLPAGTRLVVNVADSLPTIQTDRTLLARALTNLVENALQAMPSGGVLTIAVRRAGESIEIEIADTGVGMDEESVRRAFEPYFSTKTAGSGLGLANAQRNIEICGGRIELTSQPGAGTTVTVTVPIVRPVASANA